MGGSLYGHGVTRDLTGNRPAWSEYDIDNYFCQPKLYINLLLLGC